jgi:NDP-sugar pyrophosphorylase family protein
MTRRAVILAGGKGTRLRPYTVVLPKPLMPIGEYPILEVVIRQLATHGFEHISLAVNHQAELIKAFCGDGSRWGVHIDYSLEQHPLGTMGPLRLLQDLPSHFLVMNGDVLTDLDYSAFFDAHSSADSLFTISSYVRQHTIDYGVLRTTDHVLREFSEKPTASYEVSMGVYMISREVVDFIPEARQYGFDELMNDLLRAHRRVDVRPFDGYWLDIGRVDDYAQAIEEFGSLRARFLRD